MSRSAFILVLAANILLAASLAGAAQNPAPNAPLPNTTELLQRLLANEHKLAAQREQYDCRITDRTIETDGKGNTKKDTSVVSDLFYVNGIPIERTLQKDGKDLSSEDQLKQDDRVMKETLKYGNQANAQKEEDKNNQELEDFIEAMMLANGHRERVDGRSVLFYDILPNPRFQAKNLNQHLAQVMQGKISIRGIDRYQCDVGSRLEDWRRAVGQCAQGPVAAHPQSASFRRCLAYGYG
jgi:hypothetical protein